VNKRVSRLQAYSVARLTPPRNARAMTTRRMIPCIVVARCIQGSGPGEDFVNAPFDWQIQPHASFSPNLAREATKGVVSRGGRSNAPTSGRRTKNITTKHHAAASYWSVERASTWLSREFAKHEHTSATIPLERLIRTRTA
jgi:hypothetical protein